MDPNSILYMSIEVVFGFSILVALVTVVFLLVDLLRSGRSSITVGIWRTVIKPAPGRISCRVGRHVYRREQLPACLLLPGSPVGSLFGVVDVCRRCNKLRKPLIIHSYELS